MPKPETDLEAIPLNLDFGIVTVIPATLAEISGTSARSSLNLGFDFVAFFLPERRNFGGNILRVVGSLLTVGNLSDDVRVEDGDLTALDTLGLDNGGEINEVVILLEVFGVLEDLGNLGEDPNLSEDLTDLATEDDPLELVREDLDALRDVLGEDSDFIEINGFDALAEIDDPPPPDSETEMPISLIFVAIGFFDGFPSNLNSLSISLEDLAVLSIIGTLIPSTLTKNFFPVISNFVPLTIINSLSAFMNGITDCPGFNNGLDAIIFSIGSPFFPPSNPDNSLFNALDLPGVVPTDFGILIDFNVDLIIVGSEGAMSKDFRKFLNPDGRVPDDEDPKILKKFGEITSAPNCPGNSDLIVFPLG